MDTILKMKVGKKRKYTPVIEIRDRDFISAVSSKYPPDGGSESITDLARIMSRFFERPVMIDRGDKQTIIDEF